MSKKFYLLIYIVAPSVLGYLHNLFYLKGISIPIINYIYMYALPFLMVYFWFWVGGQFAQNKIKVFPSVLVGNLVGIVSLLVYFWQFALIPDNQMNLFLASKSQHFSSLVSIYVARIAVLFEPDKNVIGSVSFYAMQIIGLVLMIIVFTAGYFYKIKRTNSMISK